MRWYVSAGKANPDGVGGRRGPDPVQLASGLVIESGSTKLGWTWRRLWVADDCSAVLALSSETEPSNFWLWASNALVVSHCQTCIPPFAQ